MLVLVNPQLSVPILFGVPSPRDSISAISISAIVLIAAVAINILFQVNERTPVFALYSMLLFVHAIVALRTTNYNLLFNTRYFLVWILIALVSILWAVYPGEIYAAPFGVQYQTYEFTNTVVLAGILGLCGSLLGWHFSFQIKEWREISSVILDTKKMRLMLTAGLLITIILPITYVWVSGGVIGIGKTYGDGNVGASIEFGVFNIFHFFGISLLILSSISKDGSLKKSIILFSLFTLLIGMLSGSRADYLPQFLIVFSLLCSKSLTSVLMGRSLINKVGLLVLVFNVIVIAYFFATLIAYWRDGVPLIEALAIVGADWRSIVINDFYGHRIFWIETGNMIIGTLYAAVVNVKQNLVPEVYEGVSGLLLGKSYFDYIIISPPAFLGLSRPLGLDWAGSINGEIMSQGGVFEIAEAYWNFGLAGAFFVPMFISFIFGRLLVNGLHRSNYFYLCGYIVFGLHGFRSIWYQNFSYFRLITVLIVIYCFSLVLARWFVANKKIVSAYS